MKDHIAVASYVDPDHHQGDDGDVFIETPQVPVVSNAPGSGGDGRGGSLHTRVFQQSVTLTASMYENGTATTATTSTSSGSWTGLIWRISSDRIPLLVGVFCGGALIVFILLTLLIYRCCIMPRREKHYCMRKTEPEPHVPQGPPQMYPSHSAVFADPKSGQLTYSARLISPIPGNSGRQHWFYNNRMVGAGIQCTQCPGTCPVPRSSSNPGPASTSQQQITITQTPRRQRPVSQPIRFGPCDLVNGEKKIPMPEICEFSPQNVLYASSSILDEVGTKDEEGEGTGTTNLKTRSLPAWVRSKPRPLSTEDDLADLYAKVNFSKKRKNRMRNDEAAIIALSKSRSQFLHKDTDSLVDNEAVIVYDERTAL